jgi:hypothetical protein
MSYWIATVKRVVDENVIAGDRPLHGLIRLENSDLYSFAAVPYQAAAESVAHKYTGTQRCDRTFQTGYSQLLDLVRKLLRSLQLLGIATAASTAFIRRATAILDRHGIDESTFIEVAGPDHPMHHDEDIAIAADSCLVYSRIIADCIAKTLPSLFGEPPYRGIKRNSFRDVMKYASTHPETPLGELFTVASLDWFNVLSGGDPERSDARKGVRENLIHYGAFTSVSWSSPNPGEQGASDVKIRLHQKNQSEILSDLLVELSAICGGLFGFMDWACLLAMKQERRIDFRERNDLWKDVIYIADPVDFIGTMIPRLNQTRNTPAANTG